MNEPKVAIIVLIAALLIPGSRDIAAQLASKVEASQYTISDGALPLSAIRFAPTVQFEFPNATLKARGSAFLSEQNLQLADGIVSGTFTSPTVYGVRAEMIGNASRAVDERSLGTDQVDVQTRIHLRFHEYGGLWVGGGVARPWRVAVFSAADVTDAGAWTKIGSPTARFGTATMTATFTNFAFTKIASVHDTVSAELSCATNAAMPLADRMPVRALFSESSSSGACERQSRFGDLEGSLHWEVGAIELSAQMGRRFGDSYDVTADSRQWSAATATVWLTDRIAIVGGGGRQPALPLRGLPARSFGMAGLEVAYWPMSKSAVPVSLPRAVLVKSFEMRPMASGMHKIVIHVRGVETVDVMGDFSDWSPLMLSRRGRDLWELSVPLSPGMHQINVRVDGGPWMAPPGMPVMKDSFGGEVGLIGVNSDKPAP
jgi:hypothetical protein